MNKSIIVILFLLVGKFCFVQAFRSKKKKALNLFEQARQAFDSNQFNKSLLLLNNAIKLDSTFVEAYLLKSDIYQELDSVSALIHALEKALHFNPEKFVKSYYILGNAYYKSGFYQKANESYQSYLNRVAANAPFVEKVRQNMKKCEGAVHLLKKPVPFNSINLGENINSVNDEYWPSITVDGKTIIFTRLVGSNIPTADRKTNVQEDFFTANKENNAWRPFDPI